MCEFQTIAKVGDIPEGEGRCFPVSGTMVAVFQHQGQFFAVNDFCPHQGASLSPSPVAEDGSIMCPWHAWCFSVRDGSWLDAPGSKLKVPSYELQVVDDEIQVKVPEPPSGNPSPASPPKL